ncbi:efflux pump antibiotic resistance protein [Talaromyces pinophilus]|uniref:Efflux pump antibiotic resistance protein n=1 Tax=Talaromyces pinophilus TaxID=128442 RepID=A0A0B8MY43_TALPI|nr:efflux pump antibiotic resistance protein [Talaromyces pinophilus]
MEVSIVSTALVSITTDLGGFSETSWIVTGFLASYTSFFPIWIKIRDLVGRKYAILVSASVSVAFSGGGGGSSSITQLIIFRVFQGVGAAGIYGVCVLCIYELVPPYKLPTYGAPVAVTVAGATAAGPLLGGAITDAGHSVWRWIFYLNLAAGAVAAVLIALAMPASFPNDDDHNTAQKRHIKDWLSELDIRGALLLSGTFLLIIALFEASTRFSWSSSVTIGLLVGSGVSWICFFIWERYITLSSTSKQQPVFSVALPLQQKLDGHFRFRTILRVSPLEAGVRLLPYVLGSPIGAVISNLVCSKFNLAFITMLLAGGILQVIGLPLLATLTTEPNFPRVGYFEETLSGLGIGITFSILILETPFTADPQDLAAATGAVIQVRFLGGATGLGISSALTNSLLRSRLANTLSAEQLSAVLESVTAISGFSPAAQRAVQLVFVTIYNRQLAMVAGVGGAQLLAALLVWKKGSQLRPVQEKKTEER